MMLIASELVKVLSKNIDRIYYLETTVRKAVLFRLYLPVGRYGQRRERQRTSKMQISIISQIKKFLLSLRTTPEKVSTIRYGSTAWHYRPL
jgi:hypothetical protein